MKLYILNALITPFDSSKTDNAFFAIKKINKDEFEQILSGATKRGYEIESVLGHKSTVDFLKEEMPGLEEHFTMNRTEISIDEGDLALVIRINVRGNKMQEHSLEDLMKFKENGNIDYLTLARVYHPDLVFNPLKTQEESNV